MPISIEDVIRKHELFQGFHVAPIPHRQAQALVLLAFGVTDIEGASILSIAPETFREHHSKARALVLPVEHETTRANAQYWAPAPLG